MLSRNIRADLTLALLLFGFSLFSSSVVVFVWYLYFSTTCSCTSDTSNRTLGDSRVSEFVGDKSWNNTKCSSYSRSYWLFIRLKICRQRYLYHSSRQFYTVSVCYWHFPLVSTISSSISISLWLENLPHFIFHPINSNMWWVQLRSAFILRDFILSQIYADHISIKSRHKSAPLLCQVERTCEILNLSSLRFVGFFSLHHYHCYK